jgi:hypothetical protein
VTRAPRTLELDAAAERSVAWLRLVAALASLVAAGWLVMIVPPGRGLLCAGLGAAGALLWLGLFVRGRCVVRRAGEHRVVLGAGELTLHEGPRVVRIPWEEIASVRADEEHLVVEVMPHTGAPLGIEPRYGGLGMYELAAAIEEARIEGCVPDGASLQLRRSAGPDDV